MEIRPILSALSRNRTGALLIATQVALTLAIISNAASVIRDRLALSERPSGVTDEASLLTARPILNARTDLAALIRADLAGLAALPGVRAVTVTNQLPMGRSGWSLTFSAGREESAVSTNASYTFDGGGLLETLGLRLIEGRRFEAAEVRELDPEQSAEPPREALVTAALARHLFRDEGPWVGRVFYSGNGPQAGELRIVGVVERLTTPWGLAGEEDAYTVIVPQRFLNSYNYYVMRVETGAEAAVRTAIDEVLTRNEPDRVNTGIYSVQELRERRYRNEKSVAWLLVSVTVFLLLVTASGIVGMASLWVNLRRKQIGVRRALGATRADILRYFLTENLLITSGGVLAGVLAARLLNQLLVRELSVPALPWDFLAVGVACLFVLGLAAALGPALRASRLSPALATRSV